MQNCIKLFGSVSSAILGKLSKLVVACAMASVAFAASGGNVTTVEELYEAIEKAEPGDTVQMAAGEFALTKTLTLDKNVKVVGAGVNQTVLTMGGAGFRGLLLDNADAVVSDLTVRGFSVAANGAGAYVKNGTLLRVKVTKCHSLSHDRAKGGGVYMENGTLQDCDIVDNELTGGYWYTYGGGVYALSGAIDHCRITGNVCSGNERCGGLAMRADGEGSGSAVARYCYIAGNSGAARDDNGGCGAIVGTGTRLENSIVCSNGVSGVKVVGVLRNTLVFGHRNTSSGYSGVLTAGGTVQNCTIVDNVTSSDASGLSGLKQTSGTTVNTIVWGNGSVRGASVTGGTFATNVVDKAVAAGVGCLVADPRFRNAAEFDYHLGLGSSAIGKAAPIAAVTNDLDDVERNADGKGADIGCYEYVPAPGGKLSCTVASEASQYIGGESVTLKAFVEGGTGPYVFSWYLDGADTAAQSGADDTYVWENAAGGGHDVRLVVTDAVQATAEAVEQRIFSVLPLATYADVKGGNVYPYDTPDKAAHSLADALAAVWVSASTTATVHIAAGTYPIVAPIGMSLPIRIVGTNASVTVVDSSGNAGRAFTLENEGSEIRGITIAHAKAGMRGGAAYISAGCIADAIVTNCTASVMDGGALYMDGGIITNTVITQCWASRNGPGYEHGEALYQTKGRVIDCLFIANKAPGEYSNGLGAYTTGGTIESCIFTRHAATPVMVAGGTLVNCLVYGNTCAEADGSSYRKTSGVMLASGKVIGCTITGNAASGSCATAPGVVADGGTLVNCIVWGNTSSIGTAGASFGSNAVVENNLFDFVAGKGTGNLNGDPRFVDAAVNDYRLSLGSSAVNKGKPVADVAAAANDFAFVPRNADGSGWEIGAYEYSSAGGPLACAVQADNASVLKGSSVTLTAIAEGGSGTGYTYAWYMGGGETPMQEGESSTLVLENPDCGKYTVRVVVTDSQGATAECVEADLFAVRSTVAYADPNGSNTYPYDTADKAAHNVNDAFDAMWTAATLDSTLYVAAGTYPLAKGFVLDRSIRILGAGADAVTLDAKGITSQIVQLGHDNAVVSGLTLANAKATKAGGGASVSKGLLTGCVITNCTGATMNGGGVVQSGGVISNTVITRCYVSRNNTGYNHGEGLYQTAGRVYGCTFSANYCNSDFSNGLGAYTTGGTIENSVFTAHGETPVMVAGGTLLNCLVCKNTCKSGDNGSYRKTSGVMLTSGKVINCTIADNVASGNCKTASGLQVEGGRAVNNIVWGNVSSNAIASVVIKNAPTVNTNLFDVAVDFGVGNAVGDPHFRNFRRGDFRLKGNDNPCIDKGDNSVWDGVADPRDLDGKPRIDKVGKVVDLGCFEHEFIGLMLLVK